MVQSRSNRSLLFGGRSVPSVGDASTEALETENQRGVDMLGGSTALMKDIAIAIESEVAEQNGMLGRVDSRFDSASSVVGKTLSALRQLANDRTASKLCYMIGGFFVLLVLIYLIFKKN